MELIRSNGDKAVGDENNKKKSYCSEIVKEIRQLNALRLTKPDMNNWSIKECGCYLQYEKQKGVLAMPKNISNM